MPVSTTRPALRTDRMAAWVGASLAAQSMAQSTPRFDVSARIWRASSICVGSSVAWAPMWRASSRRCGTGSIAQMRPAPATLRQAIVSSPMGPAPKTATVSPGWIAANCMECMATASGSTMVASSRGMSGGMASRLATGRLTNSRKNPGMPALLIKRSKAFHDALFGDLADNTIPDQVAGIKELAAKYPWIDVDRVGIYGHSGGGAAAAAAMFHFPDFFKVG